MVSVQMAERRWRCLSIMRDLPCASWHAAACAPQHEDGSLVIPAMASAWIHRPKWLCCTWSLTDSSFIGSP